MLRAADTTKRTDTGLARGTNEDSAFARAPVFVVADGMGGAQAGEVASRIAVDVFEQGLPNHGTAPERLVEGAREANRRIHERSRQSADRHGMGTTLTAALLDGDDLAIAHVGDSRAYLFRDGRLQRLTQDHTLVGALVAEGKLTEDQAAEHPQRSIITRALGPEPEVEVDTWSYRLRDGDIVLLCSDGLTSMISEPEITGLLAEAAGRLGDAAERLIAAANAAGGRDNITVVAFRTEEISGPADAEQPTLARIAPVGDHAATASGAPPPPPPAPPPPGIASEESRDRGSGAALATVSAPARSAAPPAAVRPGPALTPPAADGPGGEPASGHGPSRLVATVVSTVVVLFLVGAGGWLASRQLFFVGINPQGIVTIYRGLPYDLPLGVSLYESFYVSGVPAANIPATRRAQLLDNHLRSERDASSLVRDLELGRLAK